MSDLIKPSSVDMVCSPPHYTQGRFEAIDVIEDAVSRAPDPILGSLQWQVLKYLLRIWDKEDPCLDAGKARWYLNRLISKLEEAVAVRETGRPTWLSPQDDSI